MEIVTIASLIGWILTIGGFVISIKVNMNDVKHLTEEMLIQRNNIGKIFDEISDLKDRIGKIEGRLNGIK